MPNHSPPQEQDYFKVRISGDVRLALPLSHISTVVQIERQLVCPIPGVDPALLGVINRQGSLTWVLDLSYFLDLGFVTLQPGQRLTAITLSDQPTRTAGATVRYARTVACVVSELEGVFAPLHVQAIDKKLKPKLRPLLRYVAYHDRAGIAILDPAQLLETLQLQGSTAAPAISSLA